MRNKLLLLTTVSTLTLFAQIPDFRPPTPLFGAIMKNDAQAVRKLLAEGADPNQGQFFGQTPLVLAINNANLPVVRELLQGGADVKVTDQHGSTTLMRAVASESPDMGLVEDLIRRGVDPNAQNKFGETALSSAVKRGDMKAVERLKAAGASDAAAVRGAVEKAVASLQKSGPQFVKVSGCVSCHHQSVPQIAYAAARQHGYQVDEAISAQQVKAVMAIVRPIRELLEKDAIALPNPGITVSYFLLGLHAEGYAPDKTTAAMALAVQRTQLPDGSFSVAGSRPPMESSPFTSTALSIRALQLYGKEDVDAKVVAARQWLERTKPVTQEERAMRLMGLSWAKADASLVERAAADVTSQQRADGGWSQLASVETDAYATGLALYSLNQAGVPPGSPVYQKGVAYLLRTQMADGTWLVRTRSNPVQPLKDSGFPHGRDQWISAAGTGWASIALSLSQPVAAPKQESNVSAAAAGPEAR